MDAKIKKLDKSKKIQLEILRKFSGEKRVYLGAELYDMARQLIKDGIRNRHPDLEEKELEKRTREIISS